MTISHIQEKAFEIATKRGLDKQSIHEATLHLVGEVAEFIKAKRKAQVNYFYDLFDVSGEYVNAYRHYISNTKDDELADIVILACSMAQKLDIDLEGAISRKMRFNEIRRD